MTPLSVPLLELQAAGFAYPGGPMVLESLDLTVARGESVAIIGPNGCGKSSLLKLLAGVEAVSAGSYRFAGQAVDSRSLARPAFARDLHRQVGLVFQNPETQLFCPTVYDEVAFGPRHLDLDAAEVDRRCRDCLDLLGLAHLAGAAPFRLSGGEKRKVSLACVLSLNPAVLVLDEPMNGLDPRSKQDLRRLLLRLKAGGKTLVGSTHDFAYVEGIFDRVVVLGEDHRVLRQGSWDQVVQDHDFLRACNVE